MGLYTQSDLETYDGGEIMFEDGDVKLASVKRSHVQALNWLIASNRGDTINGDSLADLGAFFGDLNIPRTHRNMEANIRRALFFQRMFIGGDVTTKIIPIDENEVVVTVRLRGEFAERSADDLEIGYDTVLAYRFPFGTAKLEKINVPTQ